jgi:hypothetical protein
MSHFEMALEHVTTFECALAALHGAKKFAVTRSIDSNSTGGGTNLAG